MYETSLTSYTYLLDSDTNGAIAGGLLGARDGVEKIPERWLGKLQFRKEFEEVARRILEVKE